MIGEGAGFGDVYPPVRPPTFLVGGWGLRWNVGVEGQVGPVRGRVEGGMSTQNDGKFSTPSEDPLPHFQCLDAETLVSLR